MNIAIIEEKILNKYNDRYIVAKAIGKRAVQIRQNEMMFKKEKRMHKNVVEAAIELAEGKSKIVW